MMRTDSLSFYKYVLLKRRSFEALLRHYRVLSELVEINTRPDASSLQSGAACIIFTMDRALQLHALLSSYYEKVQNAVPLYILYRASSSEHKNAYTEVFSIFDRYQITVTNQISKNSFRPQFISIIESCNAEKIFCLVDDIVFTENIDMQDFVDVDIRTAIASLRLGANLTRAYTVQKNQKQPSFVMRTQPKKDKLGWIWRNGELDWAYPLSLDGNLFSTEELLILARNTDFNSPNTLEASLQAYNPYFNNRQGVCYKKSKILNIPLNKVQNDNANIHGSIHQDYLLGHWKRGFQLDYRSLYGFVNESAHQEVPIRFIKREKS